MILGYRLPIHRPVKMGRTLLDKGLRRFPVVLGAAGLHLVGGFHIEQLGQTLAFGAVQVALHQPKRNRGPMCQRPGQFHRDSGEIFIGNDAVDETERQRFVGVDRATGEISASHGHSGAVRSSAPRSSLH